MQRTDFKLRYLKVQLPPFSTSVDSKDVFIGQLVEIACDLGENHSQKFMMSEVLKSAKTKLKKETHMKERRKVSYDRRFRI